MVDGSPSAQSEGIKSAQVRQCMDRKHCLHWLHAVSPTHLGWWRGSCEATVNCDDQAIHSREWTRRSVSLDRAGSESVYSEYSIAKYSTAYSEYSG
jgi:hypothetical protein